MLLEVKNGRYEPFGYEDVSSLLLHEQKEKPT